MGRGVLAALAGVSGLFAILPPASRFAALVVAPGLTFLVAAAMVRPLLAGVVFPDLAVLAGMLLMLA